MENFATGLWVFSRLISYSVQALSIGHTLCSFFLGMLCLPRGPLLIVYASTQESCPLQRLSYCSHPSKTWAAPFLPQLSKALLHSQQDCFSCCVHTSASRIELWVMWRWHTCLSYRSKLRARHAAYMLSTSQNKWRNECRSKFSSHRLSVLMRINDLAY